MRFLFTLFLTSIEISCKKTVTQFQDFLYLIRNEKRLLSMVCNSIEFNGYTCELLENPRGIEFAISYSVSI